MEIPLLTDIIIIFLFAALALYLAGKVKIPEIMGYLITGVLVGPNGLRLINAVHEVEVMAEIGVVLLLFTIGIEFSLATIVSLKRPAILGGALQVGLTVAAFSAVAMMAGYSIPTCIFMGLMGSLSSTAIVLKVLAARGETDTPYGRISTAILIFQDIAVIPMMLVIPVLAGEGGSSLEILILMGKAAAMVLFVFFGARTIVPKLLYQVAAARNRELFMLTVVLVCLGVAWVTSKAGLSLALGAFLAGVVVSESGYGQQALGDIIPFKDVFTGFFFVSIGMLLDLSLVAAKPVYVIGGVTIALVLKFLAIWFTVTLLGYPLRVSLQSAASLSQIGEFSFILGAAGASYALLAEEQYSLMIAVTIVGMALTPALFSLAPRLHLLLDGLPLPHKLKHGYLNPVKKEPQKSLYDHLIIVGYGPNGKITAQAAALAEIEHTIIEMNPQTVKQESRQGVNIFYGDASQPAVLEHASLDRARAVVVTIPDPVTVRKIVETARRESPDIYILARTRYITEIEPLRELGVSEVVVEEYETSVELFTSVLRKYMLSPDEINRISGKLKFEIHGLRSGASLPDDSGVCFRGVEIEHATIPVGSSAAGKSIRALDIRFKYKVSLLAVKRAQQVFPNPGSDFVLQERDELVLMGDKEAVAHFNKSL